MNVFVLVVRLVDLCTLLVEFLYDVGKRQVFEVASAAVMSVVVVMEVRGA